MKVITLNLADINQRMGERSQSPDVLVYSNRLSEANRRIGEILNQLNSQGVVINAKDTGILGKIPTSSSEMISAALDDKNNPTNLSESVSELAFLVGRKVFDFIKMLKILYPEGQNDGRYFEINIDDNNKLALWGTAQARISTKDGNITRSTQISNLPNIALNDFESVAHRNNQHLNVIKDNPKFNLGFSVGTYREEVSINTSKTITEGDGARVYGEPEFVTLLGISDTGKVPGDKAYNIRLLNRGEASEPLGNHSDETRAFATRLAQTSRFKEVGTIAQRLDPKVLQFIRSSHTLTYPWGPSLDAAHFPPEAIKQITGATAA